MFGRGFILQQRVVDVVDREPGGGGVDGRESVGGGLGVAKGGNLAYHPHKSRMILSVGEAL